MATPVAADKRDLGPLETSPQDDRSYRAIELANGLQVLLVHDKDTDKAAAAMDVNVGSLFDNDVEGCAHFCEHMLFLGTEAYPDETAYSKYLNQNGGRSNAYTDMNDTVYFFDVNWDKLEGALDRFAAFFISPLFTESATMREMQAVDSECSKNLQQDAWRLHQIHCGAAKDGHPLRKFRCGSLKTLLDEPKARGIDVRERLLEFHRTYYSSNIMRLVVLGREDLDTMEAMVVQKFAAVKNLAIPPPTVPEQPYGPEQLGRWLEVVPVMDLRLLQIFWPLPPQRKHYAQAPTRYISHLLGHEGEGSVLSYLKEKGWANELSAGPQFDNPEWASMDVSIDLTDAGVAHIEEVVKAVYAYLHIIRSAGPQRYVFEEMQQTAANAFRFLSKQQPISYASALATRMHKYPPGHFISGPHLVREYEPELLQSTLDLLTPERMVVMAVAKAYEGKTTLTEPWYGTSYNDRPIPPTLLSTLATQPLDPLPAELHLPKPNDFIPSDFALVTPALVDQKVPVLLREEGDGNARLWFKHDGVFKQPKLFFQALLITPVISESPEACVLTEMLARLVTDKLAEFSYNAALAGLHYSLTAQTLQSSLTVAVQGYHHKLPVLAKTILEALAHYTAPETDDALFLRLQDRLVKDYSNDLLSQPYQLAMAETNVLLVAPYSTRDKLEAAKAITPARLRAFLPRLFDRFKLEALVYGNNTEEQALALYAMCEQILKPRPLPPALNGALGWRVVQLRADEEVEHRVAAENKEESNHGIQVIYQLGEQSVALSSHLDLLVLLLKDEAFDQLRTKQQLGYVVFCSAAGANRHVLSLSFLVQTMHAPEKVLGAIEEFLVYVRGYLEGLSDEEYATNVAALVDAKLEKAKNYAEQGNRYWNEIGKGSYVFDRAEREAEAVKAIAKPALLAFFDTHVLAAAADRRKLAVIVHGASHPLPELIAEATEAPADGNGNGGKKAGRKAVRVEDISAFKRARPLFPLRQRPALRAVAVPGTQPTATE